MRQLLARHPPAAPHYLRAQPSVEAQAAAPLLLLWCLALLHWALGRGSLRVALTVLLLLLLLMLMLMMHRHLLLVRQGPQSSHSLAAVRTGVGEPAAQHHHQGSGQGSVAAGKDAGP